jgi:phospholipid transport system substrate-binding protein
MSYLNTDSSAMSVAAASGSGVTGVFTRRWRGLLASVTLLWTSAALAADLPPIPDDPAARTPEEQVRKASDEVLTLIEDSRDWAKDDPERFYREVEQRLRPVVDFDSFSRSVMAVHYRDASDAQRQRFADTFRWGLVRTYALALTEFNDGEVVVVPPDRPPRSERRRTVKMEIRTSSGEVYPVLYSMGLGKDGVWRVRNIIVNGINMGLTYRSQFASAMNDQQYGGDMDRVIDAWAELLAAEAAGDDGATSEDGGDASEKAAEPESDMDPGTTSASASSAGGASA